MTQISSPISAPALQTTNLPELGLCQLELIEKKRHAIGLSISRKLREHPGMSATLLQVAVRKAVDEIRRYNWSIREIAKIVKPLSISMKSERTLYGSLTVYHTCIRKPTTD